ncbi:YsnF/AvaK domain-containing protein [Kushneria sp. TE3]|uniref:YsnF/AvaK domain-containing protein n=1 Tax=Kushneria sp. TE3 TaxID=3449832 RepID=UPI003F688381
MDEQLVVAVYDTEARADAAMQDLRDAGIAESAINRHAQQGEVSHEHHEEQEKPSFWQRLFGKSDEDTSDYDRNVEQGATVIAVRAPAADLDRIEEILERHDPVDIDEQKVQNGDTLGTAGTAGAGVAPGVAPGGMNTGVADHNVDPAVSADRATHADKEETLALSEEELKVGKRDVERGTTRVRRHVVSTPVEEDVHLRDESVSVERRPVTGDRHVTDADFTDKSVEMTETDEEAVVSKEAHVREEVAIRKDVGEHTEHVSDEVRHHEVDIDETDGTRHDDKLDPKKR